MTRSIYATPSGSHRAASQRGDRLARDGQSVNVLLPSGAGSTTIVREESIRLSGVRLEDEGLIPDSLLLPLPELLEKGDAEPFRYCLNASTLRGHGLSLREFIDVAAGAGYEAVELWIDEIEKFAAQGGDLRDLAERIRDLGITVEGGIGFFEWMVDDPDRRKQGLESARKCMGLLSRLGGKRINAAPYGAQDTHAPHVPLLAAAERYRDLLSIGDDTNVVPQIEFWGFSANVSRLCEAALIAMDSGHPDAAILLDVFHLHRGGSPCEGLRLLNGDSIRIVHVSDYPGLPVDTLTDADRVYPGDGIAPLVTIFRSLRDIGFSGVLSLELFNPEYSRQDPLTVARTGREKLREIVQASFEP